MEKTRGDNYNVACPHCGKLNHYVVQGVKVDFGKITGFKKPCRHCLKTVHYLASYAILIEAYSEDPIG